MSQRSASLSSFSDILILGASLGLIALATWFGLG
jgi:hypothetical protein